MRTAENNDMEYVLQRLDVDENGHAPGAGPIGLDLENGRSVPHTVLAFHAVLGAFYNEAIDLGDFEQDDLRILLTSAMGVTDAAEYLQCTQVLTKPIEATLLATGQILQQSIANEPLAWLEFAHRIRSRAIFREALIHAAGRSNNAELKERLRGVPSPLAAVVVEKGKIIQDGIQLGVMKMLTYYPTHLHREKTVGRADRDSIGRASYGNDIMSWIGLVWLRHWLAHHVGYDNTHNAEDLGFAFAQDILKGGDAYLSKAELEDFRKIFPMSSKGDAVIETKLDELKHHLKSFVQVSALC